jgi:hypothetical protein
VIIQIIWDNHKQVIGAFKGLYNENKVVAIGFLIGFYWVYNVLIGLAITCMIIIVIPGSWEEGQAYGGTSAHSG